MAFFSKAIEKLKGSLSKSRQKIANSLRTVLTLGRSIDETLLSELEEQLISDDLGVETTLQIIEDLRAAWKAGKIDTADDVIPFLKTELITYWPDRDRALHFADSGPTVILVTGVNGSGKTTSVAKTRQEPLRCTIAKKVHAGVPADTFSRGGGGAAFVSGPSGLGDRDRQGRGGTPTRPRWRMTPSTAADRPERADVLLIDTAGRLHTQQNLMRQLTKIRDVVRKTAARTRRTKCCWCWTPRRVRTRWQQAQDVQARPIDVTGIYPGEAGRHGQGWYCDRDS